MRNYFTILYCTIIAIIIEMESSYVHVSYVKRKYGKAVLQYFQFVKMGEMRRKWN